MPIEVHWEDEQKKIIHFEFIGAWEWKEYYPVLEEETALLDSIDHTITGVILDFEKSSVNFPKDSISHIKRLSKRPKHANHSGLNVTVGFHSIIRLFMNTVNRVVSDQNYHFHFAPTLDEAKNYLYEKEKQ